MKHVKNNCNDIISHITTVLIKKIILIRTKNPIKCFRGSLSNCRFRTKKPHENVTKIIINLTYDAL